MPLEIHLTEGPNVVGLSKDRVALYVGYIDRDDDLLFSVIEGRKVGTPSSYKLHVGELGRSLEEAVITKFEYTTERTVVHFELRCLPGNLAFSNTSKEGKYLHGGREESIESVYNFFGDGKHDLRPSNWAEYLGDNS